MGLALLLAAVTLGTPGECGAVPASAKRADVVAAKRFYAEGVEWLKRGEQTEAIGSFRACLTADGGFALCYRALGIAFAKQGHGSKAGRCYKRYLELVPEQTDLIVDERCPGPACCTEPPDRPCLLPDCHDLRNPRWY